MEGTFNFYWYFSTHLISTNSLPVFCLGECGKKRKINWRLFPGIGRLIAAKNLPGLMMPRNDLRTYIDIPLGILSHGVV